MQELSTGPLVAGRFPLFTDAHIQQNLVKGLTQEGWEIERAVDVFPERTTDDVLFEYAAKQDRVFVTNDGGVLGLAKAWRSEGRTFKGMVFWKQVLYYQMSIGDLPVSLDSVRRDNTFAGEIDIIHPESMAIDLRDPLE